MKTSMILRLGAVSAIGTVLGCAALIGLSPADPQAACTNPADQLALGQHQATFMADVLGCTASSPGDLSVASACIQTTDGLSKSCADCSAANGACVTQQCTTMCVDGDESLPCQTCIASQCNSTLIACGGTPVDACLDMSDALALQAHAGTFDMDVQTCSLTYTSDMNAVVTCIQMQDGLSQPCALCYVQEGICALHQCSACVNDPTSSACAACVSGDCGNTFTLCSGFPPDAGP